jgi:hypothetical protein
MPLVYASDVLHGDEDGNRTYVKKRGDRFNKADAKDLFNLDDPKSLIDDGVVVMDTALPENADDGRSASYYELEAEMLRNSEDSEPVQDTGMKAHTDRVIAAQAKKGAGEQTENDK